MLFYMLHDNYTIFLFYLCEFTIVIIAYNFSWQDWKNKIQILVRDGLFKRLFLIRLTRKGKYRVSFSIDIKNALSRYLEYYKYLIIYSVAIKYIISMH